MQGFNWTSTSCDALTSGPAAALQINANYQPVSATGSSQAGDGPHGAAMALCIDQLEAAPTLHRLTAPLGHSYLRPEAPLPA